MLFLSTPSARRATICLRRLCKPDDISIHALREEGDHQAGSYGISATNFYPRPPRGGRPAYLATAFFIPRYFYPRPPRGGRLERRAVGGSAVGISIHALREEGDRAARTAWVVQKDFYPRPPRGGRQLSQCLDPSAEWISIHALREEGDCACSRLPGLPRHFYPRPPRGGRPVPSLHLNSFPVFLSTPSARRAT